MLCYWWLPDAVLLVVAGCYATGGYRMPCYWWLPDAVLLVVTGCCATGGYRMLWLQLIAMAESTQSCGDPQDRDIKVVYLAKYMDRWLYTYRHYNHNLAVRIRQKLSGETDGRVGRGAEKGWGRRGGRGRGEKKRRLDSGRGRRKGEGDREGGWERGEGERGKEEKVG